jgi:hypothetical protein
MPVRITPQMIVPHNESNGFFTPGSSYFGGGGVVRPVATAAFPSFISQIAMAASLRVTRWPR